MKIRYRCEFVFALFGRDVNRCVYSKKGIDIFKDGFWITENYHFTQGSDAKYWVPPSKIRYISKDEEKGSA